VQSLFVPAFLIEMLLIYNNQRIISFRKLSLFVLVDLQDRRYQCVALALEGFERLGLMAPIDGLIFSSVTEVLLAGNLLPTRHGLME
jgi:hypothetical protein